MELDLSNVHFSRNDLLKEVQIPKTLDSNLAYFLGIHLGDGSMNLYNKYHYLLTYTGHLFDEHSFYTNYFSNLFGKLFNKRLSVYEDKRENKQSVMLSARSKAIFTFLNNCIGILPGPKISNAIPPLVLSSPRTSSAFLSGLADADFSLSFKKKYKNVHSYPVISYNTNNSLLFTQVNNLLKKFDFQTYVLLNFPKKRYNKIHLSNQMDINGADRLEKWVQLIGFRSRKHLTKYLIWKKFGFCPPQTTLLQRESILRRELDINSFYGTSRNLYKQHLIAFP